MDNFTRETFNELAVYDAFPAISIYIPTHGSGWEVNEGVDKLKFKNHLHEIARELDKDRNNKDFLKPAYDLLEDNSFWKNQDKGLAVFIAPGIFKVFRMSYPFIEKHVISSTFALTPMVRFCQKDAQYFLLCLSQNNVKMFNCTQYNIKEMPLDPALPRSMDEALWMDDPEVQRQFRSIGKNQGAGAIFFGNGSGDESVKTNIFRYFKKLNQGISNMIGNENSPLVIASVDYLLPIFKEAAEYPHVFPQGVSGNPEQWSKDELHHKSWDVVAPYFEKEKLKAIDRFNNLQKSELVSSEVEEIIPASHYKKIEVLFMSDEDSLWGKFDSKNAGVDVHNSYKEGDEDLLNKAAVNTLLNGGSVYLLDKNHIPQSAKYAAAIFRFQ